MCVMDTITEGKLGNIRMLASSYYLPLSEFCDFCTLFYTLDITLLEECISLSIHNCPWVNPIELTRN